MIIAALEIACMGAGLRLGGAFVLNSAYFNGDSAEKDVETSDEPHSGHILFFVHPPATLLRAPVFPFTTV